MAVWRNTIIAIIVTRAVECVLDGIDNRALRLGVEAARVKDLDK